MNFAFLVALLLAAPAAAQKAVARSVATPVPLVVAPISAAIPGVRLPAQGEFPALASPLPAGVEASAPALAAAPSAIAQAGAAIEASPVLAPVPGLAQPQAAPSAAEDAAALPRFVESHLALPKDQPAMKRFLEMMEKLDRSWSSPFDGDAVRKAQTDVAGDIGLAVRDQPGVELRIAAGEGHWLNRWAAGLERNMGVSVYWSPLRNHNGGSAASYDSRGWLMADARGPLLSRPDAELFHEFLHAFVDRGRHAKELAPLRTSFTNDSWHSFPASERYKDAGYARLGAFQSDEILTNLHTVYQRAKAIASEYGKEPGDWMSSAFDAAPAEVQRLIRLIDTPLFLSESVQEMAEGLEPLAARLAREGLRGARFKKDYGRGNGAIPEVGEVERNTKNDQGYYDAAIKSPEGDLHVRFYTKGHFTEPEAAGRRVYPVLVGNGKYSVRVELPLKQVLKHDLDDPAIQEAIAVAAARAAYPKLGPLRSVNERLAASRDRLRELQARGRTQVDLALVREIRDAAREAFYVVFRHFVPRPAR